MFILCGKLFGWEMELNHQGMSPDRSTTDCATIQPNAGLFIFIYVLSANADTTISILILTNHFTLSNLLV
uniref:Uncharacterized protein n=1 Tax=Meloidogyne enterolobii TaxID=390850 RepID=A0A6V7TT52_MELEN|nr:unnamed protein product [Meloidogyne enterolobii]